MGKGESLGLKSRKCERFLGLSGEGVNELVVDGLGGNWRLCITVEVIGRRGRGKGVLSGRGVRWVGDMNG